MPHINYRGWTELDDSSERTLTPAERARADALARRWSEILARQEQEAFVLQSRYDDYDYDPGPCCDAAENDEACDCDAIANAKEQLADDIRENEIEFIHNELEKLGARMMRPYEHWNEDEQLMAYLERDR